MIFVLMAMVIVFLAAVAVSEVLSPPARERDRDEADRTKADRRRGRLGE
jgi:hypothetical protein